jgi:hypothetical protein
MAAGFEVFRERHGLEIYPSSFAGMLDDPNLAHVRESGGEAGQKTRP